jgi:hypothetical protein
VNHVPWPENGCTLADSFKRVMDRVPSECSAEDLDQFRKFFCDGTLVAKGVSKSAPAPEMLDASFWASPATWNWLQSAVAPADTIDKGYLSVSVYPAAKAPNRASIVSGRTLKDAFESFVLGDPEVRMLAEKAISVAPQYARVFQEGSCYAIRVAEWRLDSDERIVGNIHHDESKQDEFDLDCPDPVAVNDAADALKDRFTALFGELRDSRVQAFGVPIDGGQSEAILPSIWSHCDFAFDLSNGNVLVSNDDPSTPWLSYKKKWLAVYLQQSLAAPKIERVLQSEPVPTKHVASAVTACQRWLQHMMRQSPDRRIHNKDHWRDAAQKRWGKKLSGRGFGRAWDQAVEAEHAHAWRAAGAPRKAS